MGTSLAGQCSAHLLLGQLLAMTFLRRMADRVISSRGWGVYETTLTVCPLPTKMATSCTLMATGDLLAQVATSAPPGQQWVYDPKQTAAMAHFATGKIPSACVMCLRACFSSLAHRAIIRKQISQVQVAAFHSSLLLRPS